MPGDARAELRKFGLTVGTAFAVLGSLSAWRGHTYPPLVLWTLAGLLILPALVVPRALASVQRGWMRFAMVVGEFNSRVILVVFFYVVLAPIGFVLRLVRDPLNRSLTDPRPSQWIKRERVPVDPARYERQF